MKELKIRLYRALVKKDDTQLTDNEVDLMYTLAKDPAIQEVPPSTHIKEKSKVPKNTTFLHKNSKY